MTNELNQEEQRGVLARLKASAGALIRKHGPEVGAVAKVAAHALIPGAPIVVGAIEAMCDYAADKGRDLDQERNDQVMLERLDELGGDVAHLESLLAHLAGQLDGVLGQMAQLAQLGTPPQALDAMINTILETQLSDLRDEFRALTPELETVKRQGAQMLRQQALQGDMLHQVQDQVSAALAYNAPLAGEGVVGSQVGTFLGARGRFQSALLNGDLEGAERALGEMKLIAPNGNTTRVSEMALRAARRDFKGAERVARTITNTDAPRLRRARKSLTALTRGQTPSQTEPQDERPAPPRETIRIEPGALIGDKGWRLDALLGRGGMGEVWSVQNLRGKRGAIKLMNTALTAQPEFVERFRVELDTLEELRHPSVVGVMDWGRAEGVGWYFVMPFVEGESLRTRLNRGPLSQAEIEPLIRTLAEGLAACHAQGVIHRDLKPENILIRSSGDPVLIDFGIAHQAGVSSGETQIATGGYAPPEQLRGGFSGASVDLYALGVVWAECYGEWAQVPEVWLGLIERLTHNDPARRGDITSLIAELNSRLAERQAEAERVRQTEMERARQAEIERARQAEAEADQIRRAGEERVQRARRASVVEPEWRTEVHEGSVSFGGFLGFGKQTTSYRVEFTAQTFDVGGVSLKMVRIPNRDYSISQTQVTQQLYRAVMDRNPSGFKGDDRPVESVSWEDGLAFCNALSERLGLEPAYRGTDNDCELIGDASGFRLPFEAEWEFAAYGGQSFKYAGSSQIDEVAWYFGNSGRETHPVGEKRPNGYGLYDMSGNVWEWCADDYEDPGRHRPGASGRTYRGGGCDYKAGHNCVSFRFYLSPDARYHGLGLRLTRWIKERSPQS